METEKGTYNLINRQETALTTLDYWSLQDYTQMAEAMNISWASDMRWVYLVKKQNEDLCDLDNIEKKIKDTLAFLGSWKIEATFMKDEYMWFIRMSVDVSFKEKANAYVYKLLVKKLSDLWFTLTWASIDVLGCLCEDDIRTYNDEWYLCEKETLEISEKMYLLLDSFVWSHNYKEEKKKDIMTQEMQESDIACKTMLMFDIVMQERLFVMSDLHKKFVRNGWESQDKYYKILSAILMKEKPTKPLIERTVGLVKSIMFYPIFTEEKKKEEEIVSQRTKKEEQIIDLENPWSFPNTSWFWWLLWQELFNNIGYTGKPTPLMNCCTIKTSKDDSGRLIAKVNLLSWSDQNFQHLIISIFAKSISEPVEITDISRFYRLLSEIIESTQKLEIILADPNYADNCVWLCNIIKNHKDTIKDDKSHVDIVYDKMLTYVDGVITEKIIELFEAARDFATFDKRFQDFYRISILNKKWSINNLENLKKMLPSWIDIWVTKKYYSSDIISLLNSTIIQEREALDWFLDLTKSRLIWLVDEHTLSLLSKNPDSLLLFWGWIDKKAMDFKERMLLKFRSELISKGIIPNNNVWLSEIIERLSNRKDLEYVWSDWFSLVHHLVIDGEWELLDKFLWFWADANLIDQSSWTPLMYAAASWDIEEITKLLDAWADANKLNDNNENAFEIAEAYWNEEAAILLLDYTKDRNPSAKATKKTIRKKVIRTVWALNEQEMNKVISFIEKHDKELAKLLSETQDINASTDWFRDSMSYCIDNNNMQIAKLLASAWADLDKQYRNKNMTALMWMVDSKQSSTVNNILAERPDIDVDIKDENWRNLLAHAFDVKDLDTIKSLVTFWADFNVKFAWWRTIPMLLITNWSVSLVKFLLQSRWDINIDEKDENWKTLLYYAYEKQAWDTMKAISDYWANLNFRYTNSQTTILMELIKNGQSSIACYFLNTRNDILIDEKDPSGNNLMIYAYNKGDSESLKALIDYWIDVNIKFQNWVTILMYMTMNSKVNWMKYLIENRSDLDMNVKDTSWKTAIYYAFEKWNWDTLKLLSDSWADLDVRYSNWKTLLMIISWNSNYKWILEYIVNTRNDFDINTYDDSWKSLLTYLINAWYKSLSAKIISSWQWIELNKKDNENCNLILYAYKAWWSELIKALSDAWADLDVRYNSWKTILMFMTQNQWFKDTLNHIVSSRNDYDVNQKDESWQTLIMYMIENKLTESINKLLEFRKDIDLEIKNSNWKNSLSLAFNQWNLNICKSLILAWASLDVRYWDSRTLPMIMAANAWNNSNYASLLDFIFENMIDFDCNTKDSNNKTLLLYLAEMKLTSQMRKFIDIYSNDIDF